MDQHSGRWCNGVIVTAALFFIIAGLKAAQPIVVPFLLSFCIAIICMRPVAWLENHRVPRILAICLVMVAVLGVTSWVMGLVSSSARDFVKELPYFEVRFFEETAGLMNLLAKAGVEEPGAQFAALFSPSAAMSLVGNVFSGVGGALANTFLIVLTVVFMLMELSSFSNKWAMAFGSKDGASTSSRSFSQIAEGVQQYLFIKAAVSFLTGLVVYVGLLSLGVKYPLLWGVVAFLFNFVPNIGSIIAAVPAVLLAWIQLGVFEATFAASIYLIVNVVVGNVIEPKVMGKGMGLSTLVVFLSLVFWGWTLGEVGMLLSVPLTMAIRIALMEVPEGRWLAVLLGPDVDDPRKGLSEKSSGNNDEDQIVGA